MGKVRAKTLGDEEQELKEKQEAEARRLAKIEAEKAKGQAVKKSKAEREDAVIPSEVEGSQSTNGSSPVTASANEEVEEKANVSKGVTEVEGPADAQRNEVERVSAGGNDRQDPEVQETTEAKPKKKKQKVGKAKERSAKYKAAVALVEKNKNYALVEALELVEKTHMAKFDETVELHINTTASVNGSVTLPHGTGKSTRVAILAPSKDATGADALLKEIESGKINFDILVATPDAMPRLAKVARILGPKGLMPNPKNGTVTPNPEAVAKQYEGGHMTFKTEAKAPVLHLAVGKLSFGADKLQENIKAALRAVDNKNIRNVTLKSTMSPGIRLQVK